MAIRKPIVLGTGQLQELSSSDLLPETKGISFYASSPVNATIPLISSARVPFTISSIHNLKTASGTITASIKINGTDVTSLASLSVTSTPQSPSASGANTVAVGDRVTLVLASNSSAVDLEFTLKGSV